MTLEEKQFLIKLAHRSIAHFLQRKEILSINEKELPSSQLKQKGASFVTIKINDHLRGCIGQVKADKPLYQDVIGNAIKAAFFDTRFLPLKPEELPEIKVELSILTPPRCLHYQSAEELLNQIIPYCHGIIIQKGQYSATFLPQIWQELPNKEQFLSHLCLKAGLEPNTWQKEKLLIKTYKAEIIKEK